MRRRLLAVSIIGALLLGMVGCHAKSSTRAEAFTKKYNAYIELGNHITGWLWLCFEGYAETYGSGKELDVIALKDSHYFDPENPSRFPIVQGMYDTAKQTLAYTKDKPVFEQADPAMEDLIGELTKTYDLMNQQSAYYEAKTFKTDNFKGARELHKKFIAQIDVLLDSYDKFDAAFEVINNQVVQEDLENLKKEGYLSNYYAMKCINDAQSIQKFLMKNKITDENILSLKPEDFKPLASALKTDYAAYQTYIQGDTGKEEKKDRKIIQSEDFSRNMGYVSAIVQDIIIIVTAKDLHAADSKDSGKVTTGEVLPIEFFNEYLTRSIDDYNKIISQP